MVETLIPQNGPFAFDLTMRRFHIFGEDAANILKDHTIYKAFSVGSDLCWLQLRRRAHGCTLETPSEQAPDCNTMARRIAVRLMGLQFNLNDFYEFAKTEPVLAAIVPACIGLRPTLTADPFEMLVTSISAQQINLAFAFRVRSRLIRAYGAPVNARGIILHAFPSPDSLADADPDHLVALQFSRRKAEYIIGLAQLIAAGKLDLAPLADADPRQIEETLTAVRGIGRWTVDWYRARHLGHGTAFAAGDLAVRKAVERHYFGGTKQTEAGLRNVAQGWGEYANLAVHYLLAAP